jgi:hypothetical protein
MRGALPVRQQNTPKKVTLIWEYLLEVSRGGKKPGFQLKHRSLSKKKAWSRSAISAKLFLHRMDCGRSTEQI